MARWIVGGPAEEGWTHDETFWGERCKKYPLLVTANPAKWRVHVQGDDIKWFREIETCKVKGKDGYLYEPLWLAPEDAEARGIEDGDIVKMFNGRREPHLPGQPGLQALQGFRGHGLPGRGRQGHRRGVRGLEARLPRGVRT